MPQRERHYGKYGTPAAAMAEPSPGPGEVRRRALPDTWDGIKFEIGRMVQYVQDGRKDELIIDATRQHIGQYIRLVEKRAHEQGRALPSHDNKELQLEAIDLFCRYYFVYVNDPSGVEVIQTPNRMLKQCRTPREVLEVIMAPFYAAMESEDPSFVRTQYPPQPVYVGDCDEPPCLFLAMCATVDIKPLYFRFGGNNGSLHHVWARAQAEGNLYDSDLTEPSFRLGDFTEFDHYEELEVPV